MFAPTVTFCYAVYKGQQCLILGYQERSNGDGSLLALVALIDGGDLVLADLKDVKLDPTKLRKM